MGYHAGLLDFESIEFVIEAFLFHKLGMVTAFNDLATIYHYDMVGIMDGG